MADFLSEEKREKVLEVLRFLGRSIEGEQRELNELEVDQYR